MATSAASPSAIVLNENVGSSKLCNVCVDMCLKSGFLGISYLTRGSEDEVHFGGGTGLRQEARFVAQYENFDGDAELCLHHETRKDLEKSAALGCRLCSLAANSTWNLNIEIGGYRTRRDEEDAEGDGEEEDGKPAQEDDGYPQNRDEEDGEEGDGKEEDGKPAQGDDGYPQNHDEDFAHPNSPEQLDEYHAQISPFDSDYEGERVEGAFAWTLKDGKWQFFGGRRYDEETTESEGSSASKAQAELRRAVDKLKLGIWCNIFVRRGPKSECRIVFKEYNSPCGGEIADHFTVVKYQSK
jgi:hypothetical protein